MRRTCVFIIEARFLKASDDGFSRSLVNVFRRDLKVTLNITSATLVDVTAVTDMEGVMVVDAAVAGVAVVDVSRTGLADKTF